MADGFSDEAAVEEKPRGPVLAVEDDSRAFRLERFVFEEEGFEVLGARSGGAALRALDQGDTALVLLDIGLPGMDGYTACQRIRNLYHVPIIIVMADHKGDQIVKGLGLGADDYVTKPFSTTERSQGKSGASAV